MNSESDQINTNRNNNINNFKQFTINKCHVISSKLASYNDCPPINEMDVDPFPSTSSGGLNYAPLAKFYVKDAVDNRPPKERMVEMLDRLESYVEKFRKQASQLEEDRDQLLSSLDSVRTMDLMHELFENDREDVCRYVDRITSRCMTVEVKIHTQRDKGQEESLHQVNHLIDGLVRSLKHDPSNAKAKCVSYMNACSSTAEQGITDKKFESALLGCTLDDQKRVKKRLQGLLNYFDKLSVTSIP